MVKNVEFNTIYKHTHLFLRLSIMLYVINCLSLFKYYKLCLFVY